MGVARRWQANVGQGNSRGDDWANRRSVVCAGDGYAAGGTRGPELSSVGQNNPIGGGGTCGAA
jgi:hypothetical protein